MAEQGDIIIDDPVARKRTGYFARDGDGPNARPRSDSGYLDGLEIGTLDPTEIEQSW